MDIKILVITDDFNFVSAGDIIKGLSEVLLNYKLGFKEAIILPRAERDNIYKVMSYMSSGDSFVIVCGGMKGESCITQSIVSEIFKKELVRSKDAADLMKLVYEFKKKKMNNTDEKNCYFPNNSFVIPNQNTGVSGFYLTDPIFFAAMPLEPENVVNIFKNHVIGKILGKLGINYFVKSRKYKLFGLKERKFERLFDKLKKKYELSFNSEHSFGEVILSMRINGVSTQKLSENVKVADNAVSDIFEDYLYGYDDDELNIVCAYLLKEKNVSIAIAESLTGGYISNKLTDLPGASGYFNYGGVVYSDDSKTDILGVDSGIIERDGAVSESCAIDMANQVRKKASSDIGLAVTGIAGPETSSDRHPVGTGFYSIILCKSKRGKKIFV